MPCGVSTASVSFSQWGVQASHGDRRPSARRQTPKQWFACPRARRRFRHVCSNGFGPLYCSWNSPFLCARRSGSFNKDFGKSLSINPVHLTNQNPVMEPFGRCLRWQHLPSFPLQSGSFPLLALCGVRTVSSSSHVARAFWPCCALNTVTYTSAFMCSGIGLSNPRTVLL